MRKTSLALGVFSLTILFACKKDLKGFEAEEFAGATRSDNPVAIAATDPYVSNEVLVKFKKGVSENGRASALSRIGGQVKEKVLTKLMERASDEGFYVVHTPIAVLEAVGKMKGLEDIEYAEPNFIVNHDAVSNDPNLSQLWGMKDGYGSNAVAAWGANHTGSPSVFVGIIDEGVMNTHSDLKDNIWVNTFDPIDGRDNDGNGYIDDQYGWDFDGNNNSIFDGSIDDHGTHVAGTIGARGGNAAGVAGVCWNVKMIAAKFLGRNGGTTANAVKAVDYITDLKTRHGLNIVATNNSWGGGGFSQTLDAAIRRANTANILFIAAAGNGGRDGVGDNNDAGAYYPANYDVANVIAVASITSNGSKSSFSNYGATTVDLGAPGSGIYSTIPAKNGSSSYASYSGTSMATPHVTGAAALYAASHAGASAATIKKAILDAAIATPTSSLTGKTVTGGRLNVSGF